MAGATVVPLLPSVFDQGSESPPLMQAAALPVRWH